MNSFRLTLPWATVKPSAARSESRRRTEHFKRFEETAERVRGIACATHANYSPEWQSVITLRSMLFCVEEAVRKDDLDALIAYERFPVLMDDKYCFFISTMRDALEVKEIAPVLTAKHIEVYELASYLYHGDFTLEHELRRCAAGDKFRPSVEAEMDRPATKDYLQKCFLANVDEAPAMAKIVQSRDIWSPEILLDMVKDSGIPSSLADGAL